MSRFVFILGNPGQMVETRTLPAASTPEAARKSQMICAKDILIVGAPFSLHTS